MTAEQLEKLFAPQFALSEVTGGVLSYYLFSTPDCAHLCHVMRQELPLLAPHVQQINTIPQRKLPTLAPIGGCFDELDRNDNLVTRSE